MMINDGREERKALYRPPEYVYEKAQEFKERGRAWNWLVRKAKWNVENGKKFDFDQEIKNQIDNLVENHGWLRKEANSDFRYWRMCSACLKRELLMVVPGLNKYMQINHCGISYLYPQTIEYECSGDSVNMGDNDEVAPEDFYD